MSDVYTFTLDAAEANKQPPGNRFEQMQRPITKTPM